MTRDQRAKAEAIELDLAAMPPEVREQIVRKAEIRAKVMAIESRLVAASKVAAD
jgi:hypothetical protein